jgi:hypothetical protein
VEYLPSAFVFFLDEQPYRRVGSIVLPFANDFGIQAFHLLGIVEEQVELDEVGSRDLVPAASPLYRTGW